jgi:plasmid stability protein
MSKMIQVRNVPEHIHRTLKARAAEEGVSLSDYILSTLRSMAERPTMDEIVARLKALPPVKGVDPAKEIRRLRDRR